MGTLLSVSDLYAMKFKAVLDQDDFLQRKKPDEFKPEREQLHAAKTGTFVEDLQREIEKVRWADLLLFQFPLWWTSFPAIMKGWIDRVFAPGIAFNAAEQRHYDAGLLKGKKAMLTLLPVVQRRCTHKEGCTAILLRCSPTSPTPYLSTLEWKHCCHL